MATAGAMNRPDENTVVEFVDYEGPKDNLIEIRTKRAARVRYVNGTAFTEIDEKSPPISVERVRWRPSLERQRARHRREVQDEARWRQVSEAQVEAEMREALLRQRLREAGFALAGGKVTDALSAERNPDAPLRESRVFVIYALDEKGQRVEGKAPVLFDPDFEEIEELIAGTHEKHPKNAGRT